MAALPEQRTQTSLDRRLVPRSDVSLGVTLHRVGEVEEISAAIVNLSATGFLAELQQGATLPEDLDVDLPNAGRRQARVVWRGDTMAGCNFIVPLSRGDVSAARLKSAFSEPVENAEAGESGPVYGIGPSDPIWDMLNEAGVHERWPLRRRVALIAAAAVLPWAPIVGAAVMLS